jgi:hypothetical protein
MYQTELGDEILKKLHQSRPQEFQLDELRGTSGRFANLPAQDWLATVDVLMQMGYVYARSVRRSSDQELLGVANLGLSHLGGFLFERLERSGGPGEEHLDVLLPVSQV